MNIVQIAGIAGSTIEQVAPVILEALAMSNPKVAAALPAIETALAAFKPLVDQGLLQQGHVDAVVKTAAVAAIQPPTA